MIKKNYHWIIVVVILLELGVYLGLHNNITSLYIIPITEDLGITRGSASLAYSARNLFSFLSTLFSGIAFAKFGYRKLASLALLIIAGRAETVAAMTENAKRGRRYTGLKLRLQGKV